MTPIQYTRHMVAAHDREVDMQARNLSHAWHIVALTSELQTTGKLTPLNELLERLRPSTPKVTVDPSAALKNQLMFLAKKLGTPLRPISPEAEAAFVRVGGG